VQLQCERLDNCEIDDVMKPPRALLTQERPVHMYAELWHASKCVLEAGLASEKGSSWQFLSSIVLTAFTFEAYLNHVGAGLLDCWKSIEPLAPLGKFDLLCEILEVAFPAGKGARPLQTIIKLQSFRNTMAHGKTEIVRPKPVKCDVDDVDEYLGRRPLADWEQLIQTKAFAELARDDLEEAFMKIHAARPEPKEALFAFGIGLGSASVVGDGELPAEQRSK
jgi:hypothetical protein